MTTAEIAEALGMDRHAPARRMKELIDSNDIAAGEQRRCEVMKSDCTTYWPKVNVR